MTLPGARWPQAGRGAMTSQITHRNRLRGFRLTHGRLRLDVAAELVSAGPSGAVTPLPFIRESAWLRPADSTSVPDAMRYSGSGGRDINPDVSANLSRSQLWIMLRDRATEAEAWVGADLRVASAPDFGPVRRLVTVRFTASTDFYLPAVIAGHPTPGAWDVFTVLDTLGTRTQSPLGAHRDRGSVDGMLQPCRLASGIRIEPTLTGFGPRLTLLVETD
jgi:hypothetical protein